MTSNRLIKRITSYMEDYKLQHVVKGEVITFTTFNSDSQFQIRAKDSWENVKKRLDKFKETKQRIRETQQCLICARSNLDYGAASCASCSQPICIDCFISSLRAKRGAWVCPFCRQAAPMDEIDDPEELEGFLQFTYQNLMNF